MNAPQACPAPTRALRRLADFLHESGSYPAKLLRRQAAQQEPPRQVSPHEAMHAAAACMSETLKSALALVEHAGSGALPRNERSISRHRRAEDALGDSVPFDE